MHCSEIAMGNYKIAFTVYSRISMGERLKQQCKWSFTSLVDAFVTESISLANGWCTLWCEIVSICEL